MIVFRGVIILSLLTGILLIMQNNSEDGKNFIKFAMLVFVFMHVVKWVLSRGN